MTWDQITKTVMAALGAAAGVFGGWDATLTVLMVVMAIDYLTGVIAAWMGHSPKSEGGRLDSKAGFAGLMKKALILLAVLLAAQLDRIMPAGQSVFRSMMTMFYIANESLSILENLALCGVPFPAGIKAALEQLRKQHEDAPKQ